MDGTPTTVHAICFIRDKWNFNYIVLSLIFDSFWGKKRLVSYLAVPYSLSLIKHTARTSSYRLKSQNSQKEAIRVQKGLKFVQKEVE